ncbi:hypothetical protein Zm00014a_024444 [Zea mays]|uniref:Uncharacterized protein n=2 Tax=Zea mays TaxID=4577 RepID=A0A8J8YIM8_MAIZE|nr:uncharacterized protein LOC100272391 [Zea mays]ACN34459.1 unknown [Zea mays]ONM30642.1 hypothetical protein ZEAMMB73_Zm00001d040147 [Zea mays]ONM30644.1 hypothetical protein ZEAMMB73_Zm00001d040147 [Zea mays]PWZ34016.1 hypothetical protein Zm00014a_024444 [Zea mays]PWZ34017.1 hypothetical protein Zm00014a_024444 [Zea mays]|eukprot:NP_001140343.1 uncharacterized protein LOC100272391 [Zea mays]
MTTLSSGVLLKLLDGMKSGAAKPVGEHRTAVLQVTDIVPAELDEKDLFPKHGKFYVKVSDASHSIYATLPLAQADLVLSNKLHLGQFVHVDRLDPASPVPVIVGARPLPGRHPLVVGTPDPAARAKPAAPRRGSWGPEQNAAIKPTTLNFDAERMTPVKERPALSTPVKDRAGGATPARERGAAATPGRERTAVASPALSSASLRKSSSVLPRLTRSKSFVADRDQQHPRIPKSPFPTEKSSVSCTASRATRRVAKEEEPSSPPSDDELGSSATSTKKRSATAARVPVPGKLSLLGKDAMEQREQAQKVALEALRNASATDNVARIYKLFSEVSKTARPEAPATCFDSFLSFHQEAVQAVTDIEAIQAATSMAAAVASDEQQLEDAPPVLQEIAQNRTVVRRRGIGLGSVSKSVSFAPGTLDPKQDDGGGKAIRSSSASRKCLATDKIGEDGGDEKRSSSSGPSSATTTTAHSALGSSLKLAKKIQAEAGSWFMDFLEAALETGLKKSKASSMGDGRKQSSCCCPQSLMLRVINWVEMEQSSGDSSGRKTAHPRAAAVARKLRIKAKNPS